MYNNDYKKMTAKEFKKIIDDAELYFDCWGYEILPNFLQVRRIDKGVFVDVDTLDKK